MDGEGRVRAAAFAYLADLVAAEPEGVLPRAALARGAPLDEDRVQLIGTQGIFKPRQLRAPISITTAPPALGREPPYPDIVTADRLEYRYRDVGGQPAPSHWQNEGLRVAMRERLPLIYFYGVEAGWYLAHWPVYAIADDPARRIFTVALDAVATGAPSDVMSAEAGKAYIVRPTRMRLHQTAFRVRVLRAYQSRCAMCRLRHAELLDAAHILADRDERSTTAASNGLALCKLHHAAFDRHIIGVRPDLVVEVRADILAEVDGPMLRHGLQALEGARLDIPRRRVDRPDGDLLIERYQEFRKAG